LARCSQEGIHPAINMINLQAGTVQDAAFPKPSCPEDKVIGAAQMYIKNLSDAVHSAEGLQLKKKAKGKQSTFDPRKPKRLWIYVAKEFPAWQQKYIDALQQSYDDVLPPLNIKVDN
jgi:leucyl-tRNA synthetase